MTGGKFSEQNPDISSNSPGGYTSNEYARLDKASAVHRNAALQSASWGKFQIMSRNWETLGYASLQAFINAMFASESEHLMAFVKFVKVNKLDEKLRHKDWAGFAKGYNGSGYAKNKYDIKMATAYKKYSEK